MPRTTGGIQDNPVWVDAITNQELIYAMDQESMPPALRLGIEGGYCVGLVLEWLRLRKLKCDFSYDPKKVICTDYVHQGIKLQQFYEQRYKSGASLDVSLRDTINKAGLQWKSSTPEQEIDIEELCFQPDRYLVSFKGPDGNHLVAIDKTQGCRFFDPSFGHFCFHSDHRLGVWMEFSFYEESGYKDRYIDMRIHKLI